ncbi:MAG: TlpA disulfide reductase family protein, partial [Anaerolineales bacterium]|nr:TlpA disulfide reductase family protein [Anaerolineales bacterium]
MPASKRENAARQRAAQRRSNLFMVFLAIGLFLFGAAVIFALLRAQEEVIARGEASSIPAAVNYPAPELTLTDLSDSPSALADYLGQVVLVNNWATWCPPCKAE